MCAERDDGTKYSVLDVFGIKLEVNNARLADLLTMDAAEALTSDIRELTLTDRRTVAQAAPDVLMAMPTAHSEAAERERREFRARVSAAGSALGFEVATDGTWSSPTGVDIITRVNERPVTLAAAVHFVAEVGERIGGTSDPTAVLFVAESQQTADVFKVAIRQRGLHNLMRTVAVSALEEIATLLSAGRLDHRSVVVLLAPVANIDVAEMLSVIHAEESERLDGEGES